MDFIGILIFVAGVVLLVAIFGVVMEAAWGTVGDWRRHMGR